MTSNQKNTTRDEENSFWEKTEQQFRFLNDEPVVVLSPRQQRRYLLALKGVPKFQYILRQISYGGTRLCPVPSKLFEENILEWAGCGLLEPDGLEEKYKAQLPPNFMNPVKDRGELLGELNELIKKRKLSGRFAELWNIFLKHSYISAFVEYFDPYQGNHKSLEKSKSSIVERYIYALWMVEKGYLLNKRGKGRLSTDLSHRLDEILEKMTSSGPWQYIYYEALLETKGGEYPLLRTVTDMKAEEIEEYAHDGLLTHSDFPELFSAP